MTERIAALAYVGIGSDKLGDWADFAGGLLGMQRVERSNVQHAYRMDDRKQRLIVDGRTEHGNFFFGWEVKEKREVDAMAARLEAAHVAVKTADEALRQARFVESLIYFTDPAGNRNEIAWKPHTTSDPFLPGRPVSGFKTGPLGMGHVVLHTSDIQRMLTFYRDILGFSVTDFGRSPYPLYFFHVNGRHHSFALVGSGQSGLHHFMVEMFSLDDVGQGYDIARDRNAVAFTLGRHSNDWMTSFYAHSPSGFFVEYGWGARVIEPDIWEAHETTDGPSYWGHERLYLPEDQRAMIKSMALDAARRGKRADIPIDCPWLDSVIARE